MLAVVPYARAMVNLRVHPLQSAVEAQDALVAHLEAVRPFGLELTVERKDAGSGFEATTGGPAYDAARAALRRAWGSEPIEIGSGGAIPLVSGLHEAVPDAEILLFGAEDMQCNLHAPNERVVVDEIRRTVVAMVDFFERYAAGHAGQRDVTRAAARPPSPASRRSASFPSAYTVLAIVTVAVWLLAFVIPSGQYATDDDGRPEQGSYQKVDSPLSFSDRVEDLFLSPVNGLYGVEDPETGFVAPDNSGDLFGSVAVFFFVLAIGIFVTMMMATGALDRGIGRLAARLSSRGWLMIAGVMVLFSVLGSIEGFAEETLGFYGVIVPLMLALGYDRMVAVGAIILGAGVGCLTSTLNPFAIGVASSRRRGLDQRRHRAPPGRCGWC